MKVLVDYTVRKTVEIEVDDSFKPLDDIHTINVPDWCYLNFRAAVAEAMPDFEEIISVASTETGNVMLEG